MLRLGSRCSTQARTDGPGGVIEVPYRARTPALDRHPVVNNANPATPRAIVAVGTAVGAWCAVADARRHQRRRPTFK